MWIKGLIIFQLNIGQRDKILLHVNKKAKRQWSPLQDCVKTIKQKLTLFHLTAKVTDLKFVNSECVQWLLMTDNYYLDLSLSGAIILTKLHVNIHC